MTELISPLIEQRADPFIYKHTDGDYYFTGSVPAYNGIELRRAKTIAGLAAATPVMVWHKPDTGPLSDLIWAPAVHVNEGAWHVPCAVPLRVPARLNTVAFSPACTPFPARQTTHWKAHGKRRCEWIPAWILAAWTRPASPTGIRCTMCGRSKKKAFAVTPTFTLP